MGKKKCSVFLRAVSLLSIASAIVILLMACASVSAASPNVVLDTFSRADSSSLGTTEDSNHYPWQSGGSASISGNALVCSAQPAAYASVGGSFQPADFELYVTASAQGSGWRTFGINYRQSAPKTGLGADAGYWFGLNAVGQFYLFNGATQISWGNAPSWGTPHVIHLRVIGAQHQVFFDDSATPALDFTDPSPILSGGYVTLGADTGTISARFDDVKLIRIVDPGATGTLFGVVKNNATGAPIEGASVQLNTGETATTLANGSYSFAGLAVGFYTMTVSHADYFTETRTVGFDPADASSEDILLIPLIAPVVNVRGTVNDKGTGNPISGATVTLNTGQTATTATDGSYSFSGLSSGDYTVTAYSDAYYAVAASVTVEATSTKVVNFELTAVGSPALVVTDTFTRANGDNLGVTEDQNHLAWKKSSTGDPITIDTNKLSMPEVGATGVFGASPDLFATRDVDITVSMNCGRAAGGYFNAGIAYRQTNIASAQSGYYVLVDSSGTVVLARSGGDNVAYAGTGLDWSNPAEPHVLRVRAFGIRHEVWVDGSKLIDTIDLAGKSTGGYIALLRSLGWASFDDLNVNVVEPPNSGRITGTVTEIPGGGPVSGAIVKLNTAQATSTLSDGSYKLIGVEPGTYSLTVMSDSDYAQVVTVDVPSGSQVVQNVQLRSLSVLANTVFDTFTRQDGVDLGKTEDSVGYPWTPGSLETSASIGSGQLVLSEVAPGPGQDIGVSIGGGFLPEDVDISVSMSFGFFENTYANGGIAYRQTNPGSSAGGYYVFVDNYLNVALWWNGYLGLAQAISPVVWLHPDEPHILRVRATGSRHEVFIDGTKLIDYIDSQKLTGGYVGLLRRDGWAQFDDLNISVAMPVFGRVAEVKALPVPSYVSVSGPVVTRAFSGFFYIEDTDRASGIKVVSSTAVSIGEAVVVRGVLDAANGEKFITASSVDPAGSGDIKPVGMPGRSVASAVGLSNVGLLTTIWGRLSGPAGASFCYVDDGSGISVDPGMQGIKVVFESGTIPQSTYGKCVACTGVVSMNPGSVPVLRLKLASEVRLAQ